MTCPHEKDHELGFHQRHYNNGCLHCIDEQIEAKWEHEDIGNFTEYSILLTLFEALAVETDVLLQELVDIDLPSKVRTQIRTVEEKLRECE